jgi:hypothetical protein
MMPSSQNDPRKVGAIWEFTLDEPLPAIATGIPATFRRVGLESTRALGTALGGDTSAEVLRRFETGRRCYAGWVGGKLAAYGWISFEEEFVGELGLRLRLLPGEAYIWDCVTIPVFRQRHLYSALLIHIVGELSAEKYCRVWIGADIENVASQRGIASAGFRRVADLLTGRAIPLRWMWLQGHPDIPQNLVAEARRLFLGDRDKVMI